MLKIAANVISGIISHAKNEAPIEACGYLAAKEGVIVQQYKMKNMDASKIHYSLDPEEQFEVLKDMRAKGFELAGVYHSHPTTLARPSKEDIRLAYDSDISYVIVSLANGTETLNSFKIRDNQVEPQKIDIVHKPSGSRSGVQGHAVFYEIPPTLEAEIDDLEAQIHRFKNGKITARELRARRVPFGVYAQRTAGTFMIRLRVTGGCVTPFQFKTIAGLAAKYGSNAVHITTRQALQIHDVALENLTAVIRQLHEVGLSTRGGGGNTVRNIMASWDAGITADEVFDVTPYALSLTSRLIAEPDSWLVPRKFKISFSNSAEDNAGATLNDLGFIAHIKNGRKGFRVYVAGGMGLKPRVGNLLHDFLPAEQTYLATAAVKRLFSKYGNRRNKHAARLRFLWKKLGRDKFVELYHQEFEELQKQPVEPFIVSQIENKPQPDISLEPVEKQSPDFYLWKQRYVKKQKQTGLYSVLVPILLGDLKSEDAVTLADFLNNFGENVVRCTISQNLNIRNIPGEYLGNVYQVVAAITDLSTRPQFMANCIACAGADTCTLGICLSRGAMRAIDRKLKHSKINLDDINNLKLHISGCPDTCGLHMSADIGFQGKGSRKNQIVYPAYNIVAGAVTRDGHSRLARKIDMISARDLPDFVVEFLDLYLLKKDKYASFAAYIDDCGQQDIKNICDRYRDIPDFDQDKHYYFDWGARDVFSIVGMGMGECSAGLFDLIDVDRDIIKKKQNEIKSLTNSDKINAAIYSITLSSARMLLITRGVEARSDHEVFHEFGKHFIEAGLVEARFKKLIAAAQSRDFEQLRKLEHQVRELASAMEALYASMDDSLGFPAEKEAQIKERNLVESVADDGDEVFRDYRKVACPMNFVKVKLDLAAMTTGQLLKVLLDDGEPIENVPRSVADEGHAIVEQQKEGDHWSILIKKG
jgi:sulfite reductase (ferredoxin)